MKKILEVGYLFLAALVLIFTVIPQDASAAMEKGNEDYTFNELDQNLIKNDDGSIEPFGYDDDLRFCSGTFDSLDGRSYLTIQTNTSSVDRSLQWGFQIRSTAYDLFKPNVNVNLIGYVNNQKINSPYAPHTEIPSYNFHGSMKTYQVSGKNHSLKSGDLLKFYWTAKNPTNINGTNNISIVLLECKVK